MLHSTDRANPGTGFREKEADAQRNEINHQDVPEENRPLLVHPRARALDSANCHSSGDDNVSFQLGTIIGREHRGGERFMASRKLCYGKQLRRVHAQLGSTRDDGRVWKC